jgi:hypothetical protein
MPTLLRTRPLPVQVVLAGVIPIAYGALCGWLLTENKTLYLIASLLAIAGAYVAGQEHHGAREGALRGLVAGLLFGGALWLVYEAIDKPAKADIPDPSVILVAIAVVVSVVFAALGGRARVKKEEEAEDEEDKPAFDLKRIKRSELVGFLGAAILAFSVFALPWFSTSCASQRAATATTKSAGGCNANSKIKLASGKTKYGTFSAWQTYKIVRWLLLAACIAPFLLAYIIARGHALSWRPGEVTMIVGMVAFALILLDGIVLGRPGGSSKNTVDISLEYGYLVGLVGAACISFGGFRRQAEDVKPKPPGV